MDRRYMNSLAPVMVAFFRWEENDGRPPLGRPVFVGLARLVKLISENRESNKGSQIKCTQNIARAHTC